MSSNPFLATARAELFRPAAGNLAPLDGLRGFASCIVVFYHCAIFMGLYRVDQQGEYVHPWVVYLTNGFWSGIDIFFVLSGFLIGRMLIKDLVYDRRLYYAAFFLRRSFRIFPAYYLVITVSLFVIAPLNIPAFNFMYMTSDWNVLFSGAWTNYLYVVNYFRPGNEPSILSWGWSLCVEEHFYLILPPLLWLLFRSRSEKAHLWGLAAFILLPFLGRAVQYAMNPDLDVLDGFYYYSHNRFDEIFVGVLIAYIYVNHLDGLRSFCERAGGYLLGGLGLFGAALVWTLGGLHKDGLFVVVLQFIVMAMSTGLVMLNCLFLKNRLSSFFSNGAWYLLARVSYGTYLIHPFILFGLIQLYRDHVSQAPFDGVILIYFFLVVMLLSTLAAMLMFVLLEAPMLRMGVRVSKRYRARAAA